MRIQTSQSPVTTAPSTRVVRWGIKQTVEAPVQDGQILADQAVESAYLSKY